MLIKKQTIKLVTGFISNNEAAIRPPLNSRIGNIEIMNTINSLPNAKVVNPPNNPTKFFANLSVTITSPYLLLNL